MFEPVVPEKWMPGRRAYYHWVDIITENELLTKRPVKYKDKPVLRVIGANAFQSFVGEPTNPLKLVLQ